MGEGKSWQTPGKLGLIIVLLPPSPTPLLPPPLLLLPSFLSISFSLSETQLSSEHQGVFLTFSPSFSPTFFRLIPLDVLSAGVLYFYPFASVFAALFICIIALDGN